MFFGGAVDATLDPVHVRKVSLSISIVSSPELLIFEQDEKRTYQGECGRSVTYRLLKLSSQVLC